MPQAAGLRPRFAFSKIGLALAADADLFLTIAKFRALRLLWSKARAAAGIGPAARVQIAAEISPRIMTERDAHVNLLRGTAAAESAAAPWFFVAVAIIQVLAIVAMLVGRRR